MKYVAIVLILAGVSGLLIASYGGSATTQHIRCPPGRAHAFIAIRSNPSYLVGTIPSDFTGDSRYFSRRYNCLGGSATVRRADLGLYEVRFPGQSSEVVIAGALSSEGISASAQYQGNGIYRVALRGPLVGNDVMSRRDVAFSVVIF